MSVVTLDAAPSGARAETGGYPWASASCQFASGGPSCTNPADSSDKYDWWWDENGNKKFDPPGEYYDDTWGYAYRNCTSWVAWRLSTNNDYKTPYAIGNANAWDDYFSGKGVAVDGHPKVGSIAQTDRGSFGHVAYVEAVSSDKGTVTISDYNFAGTGAYYLHSAAASAYNYIHVKDLNFPADSDGDGVLDAQDGCPTVAGPTSNDGCPWNFLSNASFEAGAFGPWGAGQNAGSVNFAAYRDASRAHEGAWFGETNTSVAGSSVKQDLGAAPLPGQSYMFSVWLRAPGGPVSGTVALWGIGGTPESSGTDFTVGSQWTLVSAPLDVTGAGHTGLRAEIYFGPGNNLDIDGAQVTRGGLSNASFEAGVFGPWAAGQNAGSVNFAAYHDASRAHDGGWFGETNTSVAGSSVKQDLGVAPLPAQSYTFSVWLRAPGGPVSGTVALWGIGGTPESSGTPFTVGSQWTLVSAPLDVTGSGHTGLRAEIYFAPGNNLDLDGGQVTRAGLSNASFEAGVFGPWGAGQNAASVNVAAYHDASRAHDGGWFGETNTSVAGSSVKQDLGIAPLPGQSYTFSVWLRAPGGPVSGTVALWGLGGTPESSGTDFTVGSQWTLVSAPLDVTGAGHTGLRAEIYFGPGNNLDIDAASLAAGNARPPMPRPVVTTFSPSTGGDGSSVVIMGSNLAGATAVSFSLKPATAFTVNSPSQITARVPSDIYGPGKIRVTTPAGTAASTGNFTPTGPFVFGFTPSGGPNGSQVVVTGRGFTGATAVSVYFVGARFHVDSDTQLTLTVPEGIPGPGRIRVQTPNGLATSAGQFTPSAPIISGFSPATAKPGDVIAVTGVNLSTATNVSLYFVPAAFTVVSATRILMTVPDDVPGNGRIRVTSPTGTATSASQLVYTGPTITGFSPSSGSVGSTVTLNGSHLSGTTAVTLYFRSCQFKVVNDGQITLTVPTGVPGPGRFRLTTPDGHSTSASQFTAT